MAIRTLEGGPEVRLLKVEYGQAMYVNERAGWPVYVTSYPTRHTVEGMRNG